MSNRSIFRVGALCGVLAGAAFLTGPAPAALPDQSRLGCCGSRRQSGHDDSTRGGAALAGGPSAALGWTQIVVWPGGTLTTTLLPTTDPFGSGNMVHVVTDSGYYPPLNRGNEFAQEFIGAALVPHAILTYDIDFVSGDLWGGLVSADASFETNTPHFSSSTGGWIHVTDIMSPGVLSAEVSFETLTPGTSTGADYYVDNIQVTSPCRSPLR